MIKCASPQIGEEEIQEVDRVMRSGQLCGGPEVALFEAEFAAWHGGDPECYVAVNSGTAALHAALVCAGVGPGDEVIVPSMTFASTATVVLQQGARVVFADVNSRLQMDHDHAQHCITPFTKACIPVHYMGDACDTPIWPGYVSGCKSGPGMEYPQGRLQMWGDNEAVIIEDCAQAHGTTWLSDGRPDLQVGHQGHYACWSFFATKHITTGEGGMVRCPDKETAEIARQWRSHGLTNRSNHAFLGGNYRMTEIAAAIGRVQLRKVDALNEARIRVSELLLDGIRDSPCLSGPAPRSTVKHTYFWCPVLVDEVELGMTTPNLIKHLAGEGVEVRHRYDKPLYHQPVMRARNNPQPFRMPQAEHLAGKVIGLPNRPDMTDEEIDTVLQVTRRIPIPNRYTI